VWCVFGGVRELLAAAGLVVGCLGGAVRPCSGRWPGFGGAALGIVTRMGRDAACGGSVSRRRVEPDPLGERRSVRGTPIRSGLGSGALGGG